jgi:hypothetical protein
MIWKFFGIDTSAVPEEEEDEKDLDIRGYIAQVEPRLIAVEPGEGNAGF